jgi:hypothetical protein
MASKLKIKPNNTATTVTGISMDSSINIESPNTYIQAENYLVMMKSPPNEIYTFSLDSNNQPTLVDTYSLGGYPQDLLYANGIVYVPIYGYGIYAFHITEDGSIILWAENNEADNSGRNLSFSNNKLVILKDSTPNLNTYSADASGNLTFLYSRTINYDVFYNMDSNFNGNIILANFRIGTGNNYINSYKIGNDGSINFINQVYNDSVTNQNSYISANSTKVFLSIENTNFISYDINLTTGELTIDTSTIYTTPIGYSVASSPDEKYVIATCTGGGNEGLYLLSTGDLSLVRAEEDPDWKFNIFAFLNDDVLMGRNSLETDQYPYIFTIHKSQISSGSFLKIKKPIIEYNTLLFEESVTVSLGEKSATLDGTMDLEFKLWLDKDSGYHNQMLALDSSSGTLFRMLLQDSSLYLTQFGSYRHISINGLDNAILNCRFRKYEDIGSELDFYINGNEQTINTSSMIYCGASYTGMIFGQGCFRTNPSFGYDFPDLEDAAMWDIKVTEVSSGNVVHSWKGYPNGNTDTAWTDLAGDRSGIVEGINPQTRNIQGSSGSSSFGNKLILGE